MIIKVQQNKYYICVSTMHFQQRQRTLCVQKAWKTPKNLLVLLEFSDGGLRSLQRRRESARYLLVVATSIYIPYYYYYYMYSLYNLLQHTMIRMSKNMKKCAIQRSCSALNDVCLKVLESTFFSKLQSSQERLGCYWDLVFTYKLSDRQSDTYFYLIV